MHSSRMRTVRNSSRLPAPGGCLLQTGGVPGPGRVSAPGGVCSGGCLLPGGVPSPGGRGLSAAGRCLLWGGCLVRGVCCRGCLLLGVVSQHALRQTSPCEQNDRQVQKHNLRNFVADGNKLNPLTIQTSCAFVHDTFVNWLIHLPNSVSSCEV